MSEPSAFDFFFHRLSQIVGNRRDLGRFQPGGQGRQPVSQDSGINTVRFPFHRLGQTVGDPGHDRRGLGRFQSGGQRQELVAQFDGPVGVGFRCDHVGQVLRQLCSGGCHLPTFNRIQ